MASACNILIDSWYLPSYFTPLSLSSLITSLPPTLLCVQHLLRACSVTQILKQINAVAMQIYVTDV